tara:strand:- start:202 stop:693 length:492 start_codon:yes stop_codon:yes gene_type:complete
MNDIVKLSSEIANLLKKNKQTVSVIESSSGGLISSALLSQKGASSYYMGGQVIYTLQSIKAITGLRMRELKEKNIRSSSEPFALLIAQKARGLYETDWAIGESGAAGPTGNGYGDPAGYTCFAVAGKQERTSHIYTNSKIRIENMEAFTKAALEQFFEILKTS